MESPSLMFGAFFQKKKKLSYIHLILSSVGGN